MTTTTSTADAAPSVAELQRGLAALEAELRTITADIDAARRQGDIAEWLRLTTRETDLPGEIEAARVALLPAQLEQAWAVAERCAAAEAVPRDNLDAARQARDEHAQLIGRPKRTGQEAGEYVLTTGRLRDAYHAADRAHRIAKHATVTALHEVDQLEAAILEATGEQPPAGDGLRAPLRRLKVTVASCLPHEYDPQLGQPRHHAAGHVTFLAGTVPPRWVAREITVPDAWEDG